MRHVVMFSGGIGSWAAAKRVAQRHGTADLTLLFADTKYEDADTYRFLREGAANVGGQLIEIADGRTPWQVFRDVRFLGKPGADPCSRILKRELCDAWLAANCDPANTICYIGVDWTEQHRVWRDRNGFHFDAPLCEPPYTSKEMLHEWAAREGLRKQRLYVLGAAHANCGGGCVKMGIGGWARLYFADPCKYAEWEAEEQALRQYLGKKVSILRDRSGRKTKPLTLRALRERLEGGEEVDMYDIGGCGCFLDADGAA